MKGDTAKVLEAIRGGLGKVSEIAEKTGIERGRISSMVCNMVRSGTLTKSGEGFGKVVYAIAGESSKPAKKKPGRKAAVKRSEAPPLFHAPGSLLAVLEDKRTALERELAQVKAALRAAEECA